MSTQHFIDSDERRQQPRLQRDEKLFIQITHCDDDPDLIDTTALCSTLDVSAVGLRLQTERSIKSGLELDLWVNIDGRPGKYFLSGVIQWCEPDKNGYRAGIEIFKRDNTDYLGWYELFS
ncbi:MAG: PilZ domain-containing protein [Pseudomonadota bacterium]